MHKDKGTNGDLVPATDRTAPQPFRVVQPTTEGEQINLPTPVAMIDVNAIVQASAVSLKEVLGELKGILGDRNCAAEVGVTERITYTEET